MWDLRTFAQFKGSEVPPGLFQEFMDGHIHFLNFVPGVTQENEDAGLVGLDAGFYLILCLVEIRRIRR